jgi:glutamate-ammonia-ligase adenylyltransferase
VAADLKPLGADHPEIAAILGTRVPRDFLLAALALSPYLRETALIDPGRLRWRCPCPRPTWSQTTIEEARLLAKRRARRQARAN